jgi:hypothetical protein
MAPASEFPTETQAEMIYFRRLAVPFFCRYTDGAMKPKLEDQSLPETSGSESIWNFLTLLYELLTVQEVH